MGRLQWEQWVKPFVLSTLVLICVALTIAVNVYGHGDSVYTELFYIPILLAAIWYHRKAILLAASLGILHVWADYLATGGTFDPAALLRALMFIFVAVLADWIAKEKDETNVRLKRSNSELSNIIESYPDATLIIDVKGRVVAWNRAMEEMTGVRAADVIGKGDMEYAVPFYGKRIPMLIDLVGRPEEEIRSKYSEVTVRNGRLDAVSTTARVKGNDAPVLHGTASKLYADDGRLIGAIESIRDITVQKQLEVELTRQNEELTRVLNLLKMSEEKYRIIAESIDDGIVVVDSVRNFTFFNRRAEEITGYESEEVIGRNLLMIAREEKRPLMASAIDRIEGGTVQPSYEIVIARKGGRLLPVEMNVSPLRDAGGKPAGLIIAFRDITQRRQAEDILKRYQLLSQYANDIILFFRGDGQILEANDAAVQTYGYRRDELLAMSIGDLCAGDPPELIAKQMEQADRGGIVFETVHLCKGGRQVPVEVSSRGVNMGKERILLSIVRDVSDRRRAEQLQRESEERFRNVADSTLDAIVSTDEAMMIIFWSKAAERIFGYSASEAIGQSITILMPEDVHHGFTEAKEEHARGEPLKIMNRVVEYTALRKDGTRFPVEMSLSSWKQDGKTNYSAVVRDITERKAHEKALSYKNKELSMISGIVSLINRSDSIEEILEGTLSGSLELLEMDAGAIYLADPADPSRLALRAFVPRTEAGLDMEPRRTVYNQPALNTERVYYYADGGTALFPGIFVGRTATVIVPVLLKGFAIGLMAFCSDVMPAGGRELPDLLSIGSQLGIAIDNHTLLRTLRTTSNYMAEIINESPDAIITTDAEGNIISSNKRIARLLLYDMTDLSRMNVRQLLPPGAAPLVLAGDRSYVRDFMRKDGAVVTLNISTSHFESGDVRGGFIIALKDLSEIAGLKIAPIAEIAVEGAQRYHLEKGFIYLLDKTQSDDCMDIFADQVKHNIQGLCVSRQNPKKIREHYGLEKTPIVWLNGSDLSTGESCIKPDNLTGLGATIYKFLSVAGDGVVLLDGIEYLVARNSFDSVLKFLHLLNDRVMVSNCSVMLCIDPLSLETRQFHLLKTELQTFDND